MNHPPTITSLQGKRTTVMGLGRFGGGVGVTRFLAQQGARVLVTDLASADDLRDSVRKLEELDIELHLGEHREEDFTNADLVVANPAVKPGNRYLEAARHAGVEITTEIRLLVERLPTRERIIGVTGSAGKSTTTAMIGHALQRAGAAAYVGGNIGGSLLETLDNITHDDWIVLELSSFMLHYLRDAKWSPHIAVVTNLTPNHLDWHGDFAGYRADKQVILDHQVKGEHAVLGPGTEQHLQIKDAANVLPDMTAAQSPIPLLLPGRHNQLNARLALTAARLALGNERIGHDLLDDFAGLPHRLQFVCEHEDVRYFNDSKSTTPEAAILALESFPSDIVHIILGGYDKGSDLAPLAALARQRCRAIYTIGATGDAIADAADHAAGDAEIIRAGTLDAAVQATISRIHRGDLVLLSPACASWDQFPHYEARGAAFTQALLRATGEGTPPPKPPRD